MSSSLALLLLVLLVTTTPDPALTPGVVRPLSLETVCSTKWGVDRRYVTVAMKRHVLAAYGFTWNDRTRFEFDHLIPRELGGADDLLNIWPQPIAEARRKDIDENALHRAVCAGGLSLAAAQARMRSYGR